MIRTSEDVWQEYQARLRAFVKRRLSDEAAVDDVLQDVFLKMHSGLKSLRDEAKLRSWLYQITRNAIIDYYRRWKPWESVPDAIPQSEPDSAEKAVQSLSECLEPMARLLPQPYREAVILSELRGVTQKEVARRYGISVSGAKSRVQRGRALLKSMLQDCCALEFDHAGRLIGYEPKSLIKSTHVLRPFRSPAVFRGERSLI